LLPIIEIGGWSAPTYAVVYAVVYALAVLIAGLLAWRRLERLGADAARWRAGLPFVILALLLGLFLPAWVESQARSWLTGQPPEPIHIRVYYALGCAMLAVLLYVRLHRLDLLAALDTLLPVFALGNSIARVGCVAAGCCNGRAGEVLSTLTRYEPPRFLAEDFTGPARCAVISPTSSPRPPAGRSPSSARRLRSWGWPGCSPASSVGCWVGASGSA
jgi:prolipoprotein diacylglyceryltransferase